jgi:hypothetical protein
MERTMHFSAEHIPCSLLLSLASTLIAAPALAGESTMAKGTLSVAGPDAPLKVTLTHAYYVTGPDRFDATRTVRSIVFTVDDQRAAIVACADLRCAMLSSSDGLKIDLAETGSIDWWAHVSPIQYAGTASRDALELGADSAGRIAGTFKLAGSGAATAIRFDASLIRDFAKQD